MGKINNYEWVELIPPGWAKLATDMIEKCEAIYPKWEIIELKEKWGTLCCTDVGTPDTVQPQIDKIIDYYEHLSIHTCNKCGRPATKISIGWILPWCDECAKERGGRYDIMGQ